MAFQNRNTKRLSDSDVEANERIGKEIEIEEILAKVSENQKKQMDAEGIFVSEELIAETIQKIQQSEGTDTTQAKPLKRQTVYKKQLGRIAVLAAAIFAVALLTKSGVWMLSNSMGSKEFNADGEENFQMEGNVLDDFNQNNTSSDSAGNPEAIPTGADNSMNFNNAEPPSDSEQSLNGYEDSEDSLPTIETATYLSAASGKEETMLVLSQAEKISGTLTSEEGVEPQLLYEDKAFLALKMTGAGGETLQIVFDDPQDFLYSCGKEGECFYLLATRRTASGGYEHQLLLLDFEANQAEALELPKEREGLVSWISLQDGTVFYECN